MSASLDNATIAERLEAFAGLLDLSGSGYYTSRAYRRAAETIRSTKAPIAELVSAGRVQELRGIGPGIAVLGRGQGEDLGAREAPRLIRQPLHGRELSEGLLVLLAAAGQHAHDAEGLAARAEAGLHLAARATAQALGQPPA